jgi:flagellar hook-length control protein FliK
LDITKNIIKINQTVIPEAGNQKSYKQTEGPGKSFIQILDMFNSTGQTSQINGDLKSIKQIDNDQNIPSEWMNIKDEDFWELESILTQFLGEIKLVKLLPKSEETSSLPLSNQEQSFPELSVNDPTHQIISDDLTMQLADWFQNALGTKDSASLESAILKLENLVDELLTTDNQNGLEMEENVLHKLQVIFGEIKFNLGMSDTNKPIKSIDTLPYMFESAQSIKNTFTSRPPLAEVELMASQNLPDLEHTVQEFSENLDESTYSKLQTMNVMNPQSRLDDIPVEKMTQNTPQLTIAEFVPKVSEFAGRYLRIINGQSGSTEAKFNLFPEHLGQLEVKIVSQDGQVSVQIATDSTLARESLEGQIQQLRLSLQTQGLQVQKLEIIQQLPATLDSSQASLAFSQGGSGSSHEQTSYFLGSESTKKQSDGDEKDIDRELISITYGGAAPKSASRIDFTA